jgi:hypothetical protein
LGISDTALAVAGHNKISFISPSSGAVVAEHAEPEASLQHSVRFGAVSTFLDSATVIIL